MSCADSSGRTLSMRCKKDCARGSAAPLANGLSMVYGWHDGDRSHRSAFSRERSAAARVAISVYVVSGQPYPGVTSTVPCGQCPRQSLQCTLGTRSGPSRKRRLQQLLEYRCDGVRNGNLLRRRVNATKRFDFWTHLFRCKIRWHANLAL
jgi:hypothetical protein